MNVSSNLCSGSDYSSPHQTLLDHTTGTLVCTSCAHVLQEGLSYEEFHLNKYHSQQSSGIIESATTIDYEPAIDYLHKVGDRLNLCQSTIDNSWNKYLKTKTKMQRLLSLKKSQKNRRILLDNKNLLVYSLYNTLKLEACPRSIREICWHTGGHLHSIHLIEKFLDMKANDGGEVKPRLKPISAKDIILSHYTYIDEFTFEDVKQINHLLNSILPCNFSPLSTAAGIVYLYINNIKKSKPQSLCQVSNLFRVSEMSIRRFVTKYKSILCPIN